MKVGDQVLMTQSGELRFVSPEGDESGHGSDQLVGTIVELRDRFEDHIIQMPTSVENVTPPLATLGSVIEQHQKGQGNR